MDHFYDFLVARGVEIPQVVLERRGKPLSTQPDEIVQRGLLGSTTGHRRSRS